MLTPEPKTKTNRIEVAYRRISKEQFREYYIRHYNDVFNHLFFCCKDDDLSRDLSQETFLKLWNQRDQIIEGKPLLPLLVKIAKNLLNDHFRHKKVEQKHADRETYKYNSTDSLDATINAKLLEDKIRDVVNNNLKNKTRLIFIMSRYEGRSNDEISKELKITKKTVENQIHRALSLIRSEIKHFL